jgi:hypothetical protein
MSRMPVKQPVKPPASGGRGGGAPPPPPPPRSKLEVALAVMATGGAVLNLRRCSLRDADAVRLAEGVKKSKTLTTLLLACEFRACCVRPQPLSSGFDLCHKYILCLYLYLYPHVRSPGAANNIGDFGATALAEGVKESKTLTTLKLECEFRAVCALNLSPHVRSPGAGNKIGDAGAAALAEGVKESKTLTTLYLECEFHAVCALNLPPHVRSPGADNEIGGVGATALAEGVKESKTLTTLNLNCARCGALALSAPLGPTRPVSPTRISGARVWCIPCRCARR